MITGGGRPPDRRTDDPEWRLKLTQARLDSLSDYHPDGVFALDLEGNFTAVNAEALLQSGGYAAADLLGRSFLSLLFEEDAPTVAAQFQRLLERRASTFEVRFRRADGTAGELEIIGLPIVVDDEVVEIYGIAEDITERKQFQQALADARLAAESASEAKSAFLATVSHEIRTPLTSVLAAAELLGETGLTERQHQLVTVMTRSGERLLRLVDEVLDFSRIEARRVRIDPAPFSLVELVEDTMLILRTAVDDKGLHLTYRVDDALPPRLVGDRARIAQVLTNLVDNATKFTHAGRVDVRVEAAGGPVALHATADDDDAEAAADSVPVLAPAERTLAVRFAVSDTGIGLSEGQQEVVFDMFHQADSSPTREYGGTGLGLTISRELVTLMGGELVVTSSPGAGSTFTFVLPLTAA